MANGEISLGNNGLLTGRIVWSSTSNGSNANSSQVTATLQARRTNSYATTGHWSGNLNIGGNNQTFYAYHSIRDSWVTLLSFTTTINHNSDGTGYCNIQGKVTGPTETTLQGKSVSASQTVTLDRIPRFATINHSLASKTETEIVINWTTDAEIDGAWYSTDNGANWKSGIDVSGKTRGSYTISGLTANTTYNIKTRVKRKDSQLTSDSSPVTVATYDYPYCTNANKNITIGDKLSLNFYNPLGRNITVSAVGNNNSEYGAITTTGTIIENNFYDANWVDWWYSTIPNSNSGEYKIKVQYGTITKLNSVGTYKTNVSKCMPKISKLTYRDSNTTSSQITGNDKLIVRNNSILMIVANSVEAQKSATLSKIIVRCGGKYNEQVIAETLIPTIEIDMGTINSSQDVEGTVEVIDSRGNSVTKEITVQMEDWQLPTAIITLQRKNNFYTETYLTVNAEYSSVNSKNAVKIEYRTKKITDRIYGNYKEIQNGVRETFEADNNYAWNIAVKVSDKFGTTTYNLSLTRGMPIVYYDILLNSTSFNCFPKNENEVVSNNLVIDDLKYIGNQVLYDEYKTNKKEDVKLIGAFNYDLIDGIFSGIEIPDSYEKAYRITAQIDTIGTNNIVYIALNNIKSSNAQTMKHWDTFRGIISTKIFKQSEIVLEEVVNFTEEATDGCNLKISNSEASYAYFRQITVHGYLVKSQTTTIDVPTNVYLGENNDSKAIRLAKEKFEEDYWDPSECSFFIINRNEDIYTVQVNDSATTSALTWYKVNVVTGDIKEEW